MTQKPCQLVLGAAHVATRRTGSWITAPCALGSPFPVNVWNLRALFRVFRRAPRHASPLVFPRRPCQQLRRCTTIARAIVQNAECSAWMSLSEHARACAGLSPTSTTATIFAMRWGSLTGATSRPEQATGLRYLSSTRTVGLRADHCPQLDDLVPESDSGRLSGWYLPDEAFRGWVYPSTRADRSDAEECSVAGEG